MGLSGGGGSQVFPLPRRCRLIEPSCQGLGTGTFESLEPQDILQNVGFDMLGFSQASSVTWLMAGSSGRDRIIRRQAVV